ncbi:undecaprenyl-phosphate glucose phosphotransferase, partial [Rosenbergiella epipactidis]|uniref:undecaprenyl-phosphate glucose phosphotransferase n=1 Tax=Rosenbergiella epipactidis TaxID=1544694 RepID=UPI001F4F8B0C
VYLVLNTTDFEQINWFVDKLSDTTCSVYYVPDVSTYNILHSRFEEINGIPVLSIFDTPLSGLNRVVKRLEDILLSSIILLLISPLLILLAFLVKISSPGPIIFKQNRYGIDGKPICIWKFRTMHFSPTDSQIKQAIKNDPRVTKIGAFLRKSSLDELPQFINVLTGSMSIVGPRPHAISHNEEYRLLIDGYMLRHKVKPGITGLAQVNGWRGETETLDKMEKRIEFDLIYIRHWSLLLDIKIIFRTIFNGFFGKNAY